MRMKKSLTLLLGAFLANPLLAGSATGDAYQVSIDTSVAYPTKIVISGPNGFRMETNDTNVSFSSALKDGNYTFEVSEQTLAKESQSKLANGRDSEQLPSRYGEAVADSGHFLIIDGKIADKE